MGPTEDELYEKIEVEVVPCTPEKAQEILRKFAELLVSAWIGEQERLADAEVGDAAEEG